jgi:hypothetical protein
MQRRNFILGSTMLTGGSFISQSAHSQTTCTPPPGPTTTPTPTPMPSVSGINVIAEIKALRIPTGPYAGAFELAPNGRLNWYFTALGLLPIVQFLNAADLELHIRSYLDVYLRNLTTTSTIDDVDFPFGRANTNSFTKVLSDSDDSYAATFLSLAVRYVRASRNWAWWEANKARMKDMAYRNLGLTSKRTGLTSVFQAPRSQTNSLGYLMDNCEVYRGLRDFASLLRERSELTDANYYDLLAANTASGMVGLFNVANSAFTPSDGSPLPESSFYPGTTCQVYAQAFGVSELAPLFDRGWAFLEARTPRWEDGRYDPYSWAILGYVAAKRGNVVQARAQLASIEKTFAANRGMVTINELGFYQRTKSVLAGVTDV